MELHCLDTVDKYGFTALHHAVNGEGEQESICATIECLMSSRIVRENLSSLTKSSDVIELRRKYPDIWSKLMTSDNTNTRTMFVLG